MRRILFLGQKPIGEQCFEEFLKKEGENFKAAAAVSNSSKEHVWWGENNIYKKCLQHNIKFIDSAEKNEDLIKETIRELDINFIISVGHNRILSSDVLKLVDYAAVNLHLAKLPEYKGNYTYNHAILNNEKVYGVTLHWMADQVDEGDYIFTSEFPVQNTDTAYSLYLRSMEEGKKLFRNLLEYISGNRELPRQKMNGKGHFYSRSSLAGLREIVNRQDDCEIERKSRAFYFPPFEGAYMVIRDRKYYIYPEKL